MRGPVPTRSPSAIGMHEVDATLEGSLHKGKRGAWSDVLPTEEWGKQ